VALREMQPLPQHFRVQLSEVLALTLASGDTAVAVQVLTVVVAVVVVTVEALVPDRASTGNLVVVVVLTQ